MKRVFAFSLCAVFILLCSCSDKETEPATTNNKNYVNAGDWTGIQREMVSDWFENEVHKVTKEDLPEGFPDVPDDTSNVSIKKQTPEDTTAGYVSDWIELTFSTPRQGVYKFSDDLRKAGYKGTAHYLSSQGWQGAWQNGKHLIRIVSWEYEYDGSYIITMHITECLKSSYPELEAKAPVFDGFTSVKGTYYELINGKAKPHDFDGKFHAEWQIEYSLQGSIVGVTKEELERYADVLKQNGFDGLLSYYTTEDNCVIYVYEGYNKETDIFVAAYLNDSLNNLEIRYTNVAPESVENEDVTEAVTEQ